LAQNTFFGIKINEIGQTVYEKYYQSLEKEFQQMVLYKEKHWPSINAINNFELEISSSLE